MILIQKGPLGVFWMRNLPLGIPFNAIFFDDVVEGAHVFDSMPSYSQAARASILLVLMTVEMEDDLLKRIGAKDYVKAFQKACGRYKLRLTSRII